MALDLSACVTKMLVVVSDKKRSKGCLKAKPWLILLKSFFIIEKKVLLMMA